MQSLPARFLRGVTDVEGAGKVDFHIFQFLFSTFEVLAQPQARLVRETIDAIEGHDRHGLRLEEP